MLNEYIIGARNLSGNRAKIIPVLFLIRKNCRVHQNQGIFVNQKCLCQPNPQCDLNRQRKAKKQPRKLRIKVVQFQNFLKIYHGKKLVVLELGIGWRNQLIKAPMMRLVAGEPNATYVTINLGEIYIADNIKEKSFGLDGRLDELLPALREACEA